MRLRSNLILFTLVFGRVLVDGLVVARLLHHAARSIIFNVEFWILLAGELPRWRVWYLLRLKHYNLFASVLMMLLYLRHLIRAHLRLRISSRQWAPLIIASHILTLDSSILLHILTFNLKRVDLILALIHLITIYMLVVHLLSWNLARLLLHMLQTLSNWPHIVISRFHLIHF